MSSISALVDGALQAVQVVGLVDLTYFNLVILIDLLLVRLVVLTQEPFTITGHDVLSETLRLAVLLDNGHVLALHTS